MASTTLSDRTITTILSQFLSGKTIRGTAKAAHVSQKCATNYFNHLIKRLLEVGFIKNPVDIDNVIDQDPVKQAIVKTFAKSSLSARRGFSNKKKALECLELLANIGLHMAENWKNNTSRETETGDVLVYLDLRQLEQLHYMLFVDILNVILITGPINRPPKNIERAKLKLLDHHFRRKYGFSYFDANEYFVSITEDQWEIDVSTDFARVEEPNFRKWLRATCALNAKPQSQ